jgi:1-acyl-sn-glycerol-3-phosphate acyltransferase
VGREKLMRIPVFRSLLRAIHYIPIDAENIRRAGRSLDAAIAAARDGASIGMFPEGTRTQTGKVQRLKRGFVYVLRGSGLDLLPVTIRGTFALKPKKRLTMDPREKIELIVHAPMKNTSFIHLSDEQIVVKVRAILASMDGEGVESDEKN